MRRSVRYRKIDRARRLRRAAAMSRSVVLRETPRCAHCQLPPRWCICAGERLVESPLRVDVLLHFMESYRPSSTGHLIKRVMPGSGQHLFRKQAPLRREDVVQPGRELWILHPQGEELPAAPDVARLQVLLLDGTWTQATAMAQQVGAWGRRVRLPMQGESRYWLRTQSGEGRFSTIEALLFLMEALGLGEAHAALRAQFELHVYATLRARGFKEKAAAYLATSPIREAFPELLARLDERRPNLQATPDSAGD